MQTLATFIWHCKQKLIQIDSKYKNFKTSKWKHTKKFWELKSIKLQVDKLDFMKIKSIFSDF